MTGIGTVLADDPQLTVREPEFSGSVPWRVILDTHGRFPKEAAMLKHDGRVIVVRGSNTAAPKLPDHVDLWVSETPTISVKWLLRELGKQGVNEVLVEAGSTLTASVWNPVCVMSSSSM